MEAAGPSKVVSYIREAEGLLLKGQKAAVVIDSISDKKLRVAFEAAHPLYTASWKTNLPGMSEDCQRILDDAAIQL